MEKQEHYKLAKYGKFVGSILFAATTGAVVGVSSVHADSIISSNDQNSEQQTKSAYEQKATQNEQQLTQLASANAVKEQAAADSYAVTNSANAQATDQQIARIQSDYAQTKQQAASQIAAALDAMTAQINSQTTVVNNEAATATKAQQSANAASEAQMQAANSSAIAQAQQQASEAAAHSAAAISQAKANYQTAVNNAQATHDTAVKAANSTYQQNLDNENKTYQANQQQVQNTVTAAQNAVKTAQQAVKDNTKTETVTVPNTHKVINRITDADHTKYFSDRNIWQIPHDRWNNDLYYTASFGSGASDGDTMLTAGEVAPNQNPTNISEIPTDFQPGLIGYNPATDTSEIVENGNLTDRQKTVLARFISSWANGFRNWIYNNDQVAWQYAQSQLTNMVIPGKPQKLHYTTGMQQIAKDVLDDRVSHSLGQHVHTMVENGAVGFNNEPTLNHLITQYANTTDYDLTTKTLNPNLDGYYVKPTISTIENLEALIPVKNAHGQYTMLSYLIAAYDMTQCMWYGELYNTTPGHVSMGGHASSILNNSLSNITVALQKAPASHDQDLDGHTEWYVICIDAYGLKPIIGNIFNEDNGGYVDPNTLDPSNPYRQKYEKAVAAYQQAVGSDVVVPEYEAAVQNQKVGTHTETRTVTPQQYTDALKTAQTNLTTAQKEQQTKLDTLKQKHNSNLSHLEQVKQDAIKQADDTLTKAVNDATKVRDQKIANAQGSTVNVDQLKQQLTQKYDQLVKTNQAKLAQIETDRQAKIAKIKADAKSAYDAKIKALGVDDLAYEAKIKQLQAAHNNFVKQNADKLAGLKAADTKAYNDLKAKLDQELAALLPTTNNDSNIIKTGGHTIVLPDQKPVTKPSNKTMTNSNSTTNSKPVDSAKPSVATTDVQTVNNTKTSNIKFNNESTATLPNKQLSKQPVTIPVIKHVKSVTNKDNRDSVISLVLPNSIQSLNYRYPQLTFANTADSNNASSTLKTSLVAGTSDTADLLNGGQVVSSHSKNNKSSKPTNIHSTLKNNKNKEEQNKSVVKSGVLPISILGVICLMFGLGMYLKKKA